MRRGLTLAELVVVLAILAIVTAITLPRLAGVRDWIAVDTAAQEVIGAIAVARSAAVMRSEEHTSELQSLAYLVCRLLLEKKKKKTTSSLICTITNISTERTQKNAKRRTHRAPTIR